MGCFWLLLCLIFTGISFGWSGVMVVILVLLTVDYAINSRIRDHAQGKDEKDSNG